PLAGVLDPRAVGGADLRRDQPEGVVADAVAHDTGGVGQVPDGALAVGQVPGDCPVAADAGRQRVFAFRPDVARLHSSGAGRIDPHLARGVQAEVRHLRSARGRPALLADQLAQRVVDVVDPQRYGRAVGGLRGLDEVVLFVVLVGPGLLPL